MAKSRKMLDTPDVLSKHAAVETTAQVASESELSCSGIVFTFPEIDRVCVVGDSRFTWDWIADSLRDCLSREGLEKKQTGTLRFEATYPTGTRAITDAEEDCVNQEFIPEMVALLKEKKKDFAIARELSERIRVCAFFKGGTVVARGSLSRGATATVGNAAETTFDRLPETRHTDLSALVGRGRLASPVSPPSQESDMDAFCSLLNQSSLDDVSEVLRLLDDFDNQVVQALIPVKKRLEVLFKRLEGRSFGSLEANKAVTAKIRDLLNRIGFRVECPRDGCHEPAFLLCQGPSTMPQGAFQFQHRYNGRLTAHCGFPTIPPLKLVPQREDKRRKVRRSKTL